MKHFILTGLFLLTCFAEAAETLQPIDVPDTLAERVKACTICHSEEDKASRDAYYPRIAGKLEGYLYNQLRHFRDGRRYYQPMAILLENMSDTYLREIAQYFAGLEIPYPPPESIVIPPAQAALAEKWPAEPSFLALGIDLVTAKILGRHFDQNALVWINDDAIPRLVLLR